MFPASINFDVSIIDLLRLGFAGLATALLYLAYDLSQKVVALAASNAVELDVLKEKRKAANNYGVLCLIVLILSVAAEVAKPSWVKATIAGKFSKADLEERPVEVSTFLRNQSESTFQSFTLTNEPRPVELPKNGVIIVTTPPVIKVTP